MAAYAAGSALALFDLMEKFVERARNPVANQPLVYDSGEGLPVLPVRIGDGGIGQD